MRCIVFTLTLALSHQGRGDLVGCVGLVVCPAPHLWIADQVRNDGDIVPGVPAMWMPAYAGMTVRVGCFVLLFSPSPLIPLPSRERGIMSVGLSCLHPHPTLWIPAYAGMTVKGTRNDRHPGVSPHLWIADQARNDGYPALWIPAYAGMTGYFHPRL